ncbi:hypothetical protein QBC39DRAFT_359201 [Podospora conica]|nr:hypothetical protein QBC39DRAFT_359201 [Schizothecium conicum]
MGDGVCSPAGPEGRGFAREARPGRTPLQQPTRVQGKKDKARDTLTHHHQPGGDQRPADQPGRATGEWDPPSSNAPQLTRWDWQAWALGTDGLAGHGSRMDGHGHCWCTARWEAAGRRVWCFSCLPPPPVAVVGSLDLAAVGGPVAPPGPVQQPGQLIKTSLSPQFSAWPGDCLLPLSLSDSDPFLIRFHPLVVPVACSLPCFLEYFDF